MASDDHRDCVVIGLGVLGAFCAYQLARAGWSVTALDAGQAGGIATPAGVPWLNASAETDPAYIALRLRGLALYQRLGPELGEAKVAEFTGNIEWRGSDVTQEQANARAASLARLGVLSEVADGRRVTDQLEPELHIDQKAACLVLPEEGFVRTTLLIQALMTAARSAGASIRTQAGAARLEPCGDKVAVVLADQTVLNPGKVILCAGNATNQLLAGIGRRVPLLVEEALPDGCGYRTLNGLLVEAEMSRHTIGSVIHCPGVTIVPGEDDNLVLHSTDLDSGVGKMGQSQLAERAAAVCSRAESYLPALADRKALHWRVADRVVPLDGRPILGWADDAQEVYVAVSHSGLTLAPAIGEIVARELGGPPAGLDHSFRPARFTRAGGL